MAYPALGFVVTIGFLIGSAIYYYVNSRNANQGYTYENYNPVSDYPPRYLHQDERKRRRSRRNQPNTECVICMEALECNGIGKKALKTLNCGHLYHVYCITEWFKVNNTCPICRKQAQ